MASVTSTDDEATEGLPSTDWFDAKRNPKATFVSTGFKDLGAGKYQALGNLTIKGATQPVVLNFTLAITGAVAKMNGTTTVDRSKYGIGNGQFKGQESIPWNTAVTVAVTARRQ